jgi:hypothetical protein
VGERQTQMAGECGFFLSKNGEGVWGKGFFLFLLDFSFNSTVVFCYFGLDHGVGHPEKS